MELMHSLAPIFATGNIAFVFGDDEWDAVDQKRCILATLPYALHPVLIGRSEVVEVLPPRIKGNEMDRLRVFSGIKCNLGAVAQKIERLAIGSKLVRMRHCLSQSGDRQLCLNLCLDFNVDPQNGGHEELLD